MAIKVPKCWVLDFETEGIDQRPAYPPIPVGFSLQGPRQKNPRYYAFGHPTENNCTFKEASIVLADVFDSGEPILCHNAKFDIDVAVTHFGVPMPEWDRIHDTLYLLFLHDPHARTLALKPASEELLDLPPDEQEAVRDWLVMSGICRNVKGWGAFICKAPGKLVGEYAKGDVTRTKLLFEKLYAEISERDMLDAYDRERQLMPILLENERKGVRVDLELLRKDAEHYASAKEKVDEFVRERLGNPGLNIDSKNDLAEALDSSGVVTNWVMTKTGKKSTKKDNMTPDMFNDPQVAQALGYRSRLATCLGTFILPWLQMAEASEGWIFTNWNQVRQSNSADANKGTRTGRLSSSPNFQNIPKNLEEKGDGYVHPEFLGVPELPLMRKYIIPDHEDAVLLHRDYNQQELRILAHFEDSTLCQLYQDNPTMDVHTFVQEEIARLTGVTYTRSQVKQVNFGIIYGMGSGALALKINDTVDTAKALKKAQGQALPGAKELENNVKRIGGQGHFITTWGGRQYFVERPMQRPNGGWQTFEYKLLNYLIQGSAADVTKQAIINYDRIKKHGRFLITVHDEINISVPAKHLKEEMSLLREAMESIKMDAPLLSDGKMGKNWKDMSKHEEAPWAPTK